MKRSVTTFTLFSLIAFAGILQGTSPATRPSDAFLKEAAKPIYIPIITEGESIAVTMDEDGSPLAFALTLNATDGDGDTLTWSINSGATYGTPAVTSGTGTSQEITYVPVANFHGSDSFVVEVSDGRDGTDTITINVTVNPVNDPPVVGGVTAANVVDGDAGETAYDFVVAFTDDSAIDVATLNSGDVYVTTPNAETIMVMFVSVDTPDNGTPRAATYRIVPPGGSWDVADNGTYAIGINGSQVGDTDSAYVAANASIGTFPVTLETLLPIAPNPPDLRASSDTGSRSDDNITAITTPTFDISGLEPGATVTLTSSVDSTLGTAVVTDGASTCSITPTSALTLGAHVITVTQQDRAGNLSAASAPLAPDLVIATSPAVTTQAAAKVNAVAATGNGTITALGSPAPTAHGFVWNTTGSPTLADSFIDIGPASATGTFTGELTGLAGSTTYYVRAYATNALDTVYGGQVSFTTHTGVPPTEREALIAFYNSTGGETWTNNSGWKAEPLFSDGFAMPGTEGTWFGVSVSGGNITAISLPTNNLVGPLPAAIGDLSSLTILNLGSNLLAGSLPSSIVNLTNLTMLRLGNNQLTGSLPTELGNLVNLTTLELNTNQFSDALPASLINLTALQTLSLNSNQFSGSLPSDLGNLINLKTLSLAHNQFTGALPGSLGSLTALEELRMESNLFSGALPEELGGLSALRYFRIAYNLLTGPIPASFGNLTNLTDLIAGDNDLSGVIPSELGNLEHLVTLDLRFNDLTGAIPSTLGGLTSLQILYLQHNELTGSIPAELGRLPALRELLLQSNALTGGIPEELGGLTNLQWLWLHINQLSGPIPPTLGSLQDLRHLRLDDNQLTGSIPLELGALTQLIDLTVYDNSLDGTIPTELGNLTHLQILNISGNMLRGPIPPSLANLTSLVPASTDVGYNALYALDETLITFLNAKDADWASTQTVAPTEVTATAQDGAAILVSWIPITYIGNTGYYTVYGSQTAGGGYAFIGQTVNKSAASFLVTGLTPGVTYYFVVRTHTDAHAANQNPLDSDYSAEVAAVAFEVYTLSVTSDHGTAVKEPDQATYEPGSVVHLTAMPAEAYTFVNWTGSVTSADNPLTLTMDGDKELTANYSIRTYTISGTVAAGETGISGVTMTGLPGPPVTDASGYYSATVEHGTSFTVTPTYAYCTFDPASQEYANVTADMTGQDYTATPVSMPQRQALIAFYNSTGGETWTNNSGWKAEPLFSDGFAMPGTEGTWFGVSVSGGNITAISLPTNNLVGPLPAAIGDLSSLTILNLGSNLLASSLPSSIVNLTNLTLLRLGNNQLTGSLPPDLGNLVNLVELDVNTNQFSDALPASLVNLTALQTLSLYSNQFSGSLPSDLGNLINLKAISLQLNQFSGTLPASLGSLTSLEHLSFHSNQFSGTLPEEWGGLSSLRYFRIANNLLTGPIPASFGNLTNLTDLIAGNNDLNGEIPSELGNLEHLVTLDLRFNDLTGAIPSTLGGLTSLQALLLQFNLLSGSIPSELGSLAALTDLRLQSNALTGVIPAELGNLTNLQYLYLHLNQLDGPIPPALGSLSNLRGLHLYSNNLTGSIPLELGALTQLLDLTIYDNSLDGTIPAELGNLTQLQILNISGNMLRGPIPPSLANLTSLVPASTDLSYNALYTSDEALITFLNSKDADWAATQTIAPTQVTAASLDNAVIMVSWLPITYTGGGGYYSVHYSETSGGPYETLAGQTADKSASSVLVTGLTPGTRYYFVVQTHTDIHSGNQNALVSENSAEASAVAWIQINVLISGTITAGGSPLAGVVIGGLPDGTVTDLNGAYSATVDVDFSGTVTPALTGYTFDPLSRTYTNLATNQTAQDYAGTPLTYTISGTVTLDSAGLAGVTMAGLPGNPVTDGTGFYQATVSHGTSFTVTPTHVDFTFTPASRTYTGVTGSQASQDYAATPIVVPTITVTSPNGGERWSVGSSHDITWTQTGLTGAVTIDLYKGGVYQKTLGTPEAAAGTFDWSILSTEVAGTDYTIRAWQSGGVSDDSDAAFAVVRSVVRIDFNKDGEEDILWRYQGTGAYQGVNCIWLLTQTEGLTSIPLGSAQLGSMMAGLSEAAPALTRETLLGALRTQIPESNKSTMSPIKVGDMPILSMRSARWSPMGIDRGRTLSAERANSEALSDVPAMRATGTASAAGDGEMGIASLTAVGYLYPYAVIDLGWEIAGAGDFNGDGNTDILWRNYGTDEFRGYNCIWYMNGAGEASSYAYPDRVMDLDWRIAGTGDFDGNGYTDILWRNYGTDEFRGYNCIWYMNGAGVSGYSYPDRVLDLEWEIVGAGDFDGNGYTDILWRNTGAGDYGGINCIWYMGESGISGYAYPDRVLDLNWQIAGTGDFNKDGYADILWRYYGGGDLQGWNCVWYMQGDEMIGADYPARVPDINWRIVNR